MKKVIIPSSSNPFVVDINGKKYTYQAGTEQEVPDEVAVIIEAYYEHHTAKPEETTPPFSCCSGGGGTGGGGSGGSGSVSGKDGVSPTVSISKVDKVTTISITDVNGTKTAVINDGADGKTPVKGVDYYTETDKTEMVNLVLEELPTWNGGVY